MGKSIAIEGIIGAGKTTLLRALEAECQIQAVYEPVDDNPFLDKFYHDPKRHAFTMQMWLLSRRHAANKSAYWLARAGMDVVVDRGRLGDRCFAQVNHRLGNISDDEMAVYDSFFESMDARDPDVIVFLDIGAKQAMQRIGWRGRECEKDIDGEYLSMLHSAHMSMLEDAERRGAKTLILPPDHNLNDVARDLCLAPRSL